MSRYPCIVVAHDILYDEDEAAPQNFNVYCKAASPLYNRKIAPVGVRSSHDKYSEEIPMTNECAGTVARLFAEQVVLPHGKLQQVLNDQETNFTSLFLREVCNLIGIQMLQCTYYRACNTTV